MFVSQGLPGETSRCYVGYNLVDNRKLTWSVIRRLQDYASQNQYGDPLKITQMVVSEANKKENFATKRYLIDIDTKVPIVHIHIKEQLELNGVPILHEYPTPNGFHIITERGFPDLKFHEIYPGDVTVKACHGNQLYDIKTNPII